jgi:hypothetical protein
MKYETVTPHWPSMLAFFEQAAREARGAKRREFEAHAKEIREYIAATTPAKPETYCPVCSEGPVGAEKAVICPKCFADDTK